MGPLREGPPKWLSATGLPLGQGKRELQMQVRALQGMAAWFVLGGRSWAPGLIFTRGPWLVLFWAEAFCIRLSSTGCCGSPGAAALSSVMGSPPRRESKAPCGWGITLFNKPL